MISWLKTPRGNPALLLLFLGGIVLPSLILSVLSFRSIRSEVLLAEKAYEEDANAFAKTTREQLNRELESLFSQVRKRSNWLFDQPRSIEDLSKAPPLDTIVGVQSIFLFRGETRVFPLFRTRSSGSAAFSTLSPNSDILSRAALPYLSLLRQHYQAQHFREALHLIQFLEKHPQFGGILHSSLHDGLAWMRFRILVQSGAKEEAIRFCLQLVNTFLTKPGEQDMESALFIFESMFSSILSFEEVASDQRELFWNLRRNLTFQLASSLTWSQHSEILGHLQALHAPSAGGINFLEENGVRGFRMAHPWLPGEQTVLGIIDPLPFGERLLRPVASTMREWKGVFFRIATANDSTLVARIPSDTLITIRSIPLFEDYPDWTLTIYQRDLVEVKRESRRKMFLLYSLVGFSLLILVLGSVFVIKGISQERNLLSMKANFLSSISHELKTPLTSIRMFSEMMAQGRVQKQEKVIEYSTLIGKEANRLDNLIQAILSYTRMERGQQVFRWDHIDLADLTIKILESLRALAKSRGLEWHEEIGTKLFVQGDQTALHSMVQNLVDNAIKYTPAPGRISVEVFGEEQFVFFRVSDTGVGIAPTEQKNIFNDFYRVGDEMTRSTKGSGLGLAIVRRAAETHRATITVQSRPGKGSTFTVRFKRSIHEQQDSDRRG